MSPYQHGEVFVTDDGAETDLDLGHYERFIDINLNKYSNVTAGKVYSHVLKRTSWRLFRWNSSSDSTLQMKLKNAYYWLEKVQMRMWSLPK